MIGKIGFMPLTTHHSKIMDFIGKPNRRTDFVHFGTKRRVSASSIEWHLRILSLGFEIFEETAIYTQKTTIFEYLSEKHYFDYENAT